MLANWKKRVFPLNRRQAVFAMLLCLVLAVNAVPFFLARVYEDRTHPAGFEPPADGFEDRGAHQHPSTPRCGRHHNTQFQ